MSKFIKTESRMVVSRVWGRGGNEELVFNLYREFQFYKTKNKIGCTIM